MAIDLFSQAVAMRRLMFRGPGRVEWEDAPEPQLSDAGQAVVAPLAVALCDLDAGLLSGLPALAPVLEAGPFVPPFPFGHEAVAEVVAVGPDVTTVAPGDRVVVPFQISCGSCAPCRAGRPGSCRTLRGTPSFGLGDGGGREWGGLAAELALVPYADGMLVPLPAGLDPVAVASASDNLPDAWRLVAPALEDWPDGDVLVVGGGAPSIGLYAVGIATALTSGEVVYVDEEPARCALAEAYGARVLAGPPPRKVGRFPVTADASARPEGLACALRSTARDGICTSAGIYWSDTTPVPLLDMFLTGVSLRTGRPHARPLIPRVLDLVASGRFDPAPVTSAVVPFSAAPDVLAAPPGRKTVLVPS
jgi:alcohol dehydrogenase